jgi:hypothetical protein
MTKQATPEQIALIKELRQDVANYIDSMDDLLATDGDMEQWVVVVGDTTAYYGGPKASMLVGIKAAHRYDDLITAQRAAVTIRNGKGEQGIAVKIGDAIRADIKQAQKSYDHLDEMANNRGIELI